MAMHTVAEHVLCAVRYAAAGRVGLTPGGDGIATPEFDGRVVGLSGVDLVDAVAGRERRAPVTTLRAAGEFFGVTPAAPPLWTPSTNRDLDALLDVDADSVAAITTWFSVVSAALATMHPAAPTLWPEHFDLAVTVAGATYGGSPGDVTHAMPYLYVTPPGDLDPDGDRRFWNEPFGASLSYDRVAGVADAVAFFAAAEAHLAPRPTEVGS